MSDYNYPIRSAHSPRTSPILDYFGTPLEFNGHGIISAISAPGGKDITTKLKYKTDDGEVNGQVT